MSTATRLTDTRLSLKVAPYTPGPWCVYQEKPHYYSVGTRSVKGAGYDCNIVRDVRCEANARIMAAAPELYDELFRALAVITNPRGFDIEGVRLDIAKVLQKARGGQ